MKEKLVSDSKTTMTQMIMPNDTNPLGNLMGGNLMRWMDICGGICAAKHCKAYVVTASVDHVNFLCPIKTGDTITLYASVTKAFNTSVEVFVEVFASDHIGENIRKSNHAYLTFVALDEEKKMPVKIPAVKAISSEEIKLFEGASRRRELRLVLAGRLMPSEAQEIKSFFNG